MRFFLAVFILQVELDCVKGNVITTEVPGGWVNPCLRSMTSVGVSIQATMPPLSPAKYAESINKIIIKLKEAEDEATALQSIYADERLGNNIELNDLEASHLEGFPAVALTSEQEEEMKTNLTRTHHYVFTALSKVAVFLEAVAEDEVTFNFRIHSDLIDENEMKLYSILCTIDNLIRNLGLRIENYVLRDIMHYDDRTISNSSCRHKRDYVIVKDSARLYSNLAKLYTDIRETVLFRNNSSTV